MSDVEGRYCITEKKALGLVGACERFSLYVIGKKFELEIDHKPLKYIYSKTSKSLARIERSVLRLQSYDFNIVYINQVVRILLMLYLDCTKMSILIQQNKKLMILSVKLLLIPDPQHWQLARSRKHPQ